MKSIGIDLGGTRIKAGIVEGSKIIKKVEVSTEADQGKEKVLDNIVKVVNYLDAKDVKCLCMGYAGMLNKGVVIKSPHLPLEGFNMKKFLEKGFGKEVYIENEVRCAVVAEANYGSGRGYKNIVMITLGTGIGGGVVINGRLYKGRGNAGEFGHTTINYGGMKSSCCANHGCFEEYVSVRGLQRLYGKSISPKEIAELAVKGNEKARIAYLRFGRYVGVGITNIASMFDPEIIIIGGGISKSWKLFEIEVKSVVKERGFIKTNVVKASLGEPGIIGATLLRGGERW